MTAFACSSKPHQSVSTQEFEISIKDNPPVSSWDDFLSDVYFIPLETSNDAILSEIDKIIITDNRIFIMCRKTGIYIFNIKGKFINNICKRGKAPFQVNHLFDFSLSIDGKIYALDNGKLLVFDKDGTPISESFYNINMKGLGHPINICAFNFDTMFLWHKSDDVKYKYHLSISDSEGNIKKMMLPYTHFSFASAQFIQCGKDEWGITPSSLNNTIFSIVNGNFIKKYHLKITDNNDNIPDLTPRNRIDFAKSDQLVHFINEHDITYAYGDIVYNSNYLLVNMHNMKRGIYKRALINTHTGDIKYFAFPGAPENLFHPQKLYLSDNEYFVSSLDAWQVCKLIDEGKTTCNFLSAPRRQEIIKGLQNVKETDNPVLMLATFKDK